MLSQLFNIIVQLVICRASPPQQLSSSPLLQHSVLQRRRGAATLPVRAVGIFEVLQVHIPQLLFFLCSRAGLEKQQGTDIWAKWLSGFGLSADGPRASTEMKLATTDCTESSFEVVKSKNVPFDLLVCTAWTS